jgi:class 3 adenylate cyclase
MQVTHENMPGPHKWRRSFDAADATAAAAASPVALPVRRTEVAEPGLHHRSRRRASTGPGYLYGPRARHRDDEDDEDTTNSMLDDDDSPPDDTTVSDDISLTSESQGPSYMQALKAGAMSRLDSEKKLTKSLALVKDYKGDRGEKIQELRDRFSTNNHHPKRNSKIGRRSSITSISSTQSMTNESACSISISDPRMRNSNTNGGTYSTNNSVDSIVLLDQSGFTSRKSDTSFNMSTNTLPMTNVVKSDLASTTGMRNKHAAATKTDQIVESLVWFSFHTPRAVLEDLIAHELDIWRRDAKLREQLHRAAERPKRLVKPGHPILGMLHHRNDDDDDDDEEEDTTDGSLSSLSDDGGAGGADVYDGNFSDAMLRMQERNHLTGGTANMIQLPKSVDRESALLFVDMSGFTKLSTMLDVESLSKVINSYFDMILSEVIHHGGDILKFAGDAFFAEWKVVEEGLGSKVAGSEVRNPLENLNASLASINEMAWDTDDDTPKLSTCVYSAARCATSIVKKFSDFQVTSSSAGAAEAMLNVHCGIGVGHLVGLHVGDYKEDQEEDGVELRREFLILGEPIEQVRTLHSRKKSEKIHLIVVTDCDS